MQRHPAGFRFPKGESFSEMQTRMVDTINDLVAEHPGRDHRRRLPRRHHQGGGGPGARHAARPVPAHRHRPVLRVRRSSTAPPGPPSWPSTTPATSCRSCRHDLPIDDPDGFTAGAIGPPGRAGLLPAGAGERLRRLREAREAAGRSPWPSTSPGLLHDLPAPDEVPPAPTLVEPVARRVDRRHHRRGLRQRPRPHRHRRRRARPRRGRARRHACGSPITRAQVRALIQRAEDLMVGGRPPCRLCGAPMDPSGHACPGPTDTG